jgi:uncharacterized protein (TIGR03437 family)
VRLLLTLLTTSLLSAQTGIITTIAGTGQRGFDGDGGPATQARIALANLQNECDPAQFEQLSHLVVDSSGAVWFTDSANHRIRRISREGVITTVAGAGQRPDINSRCEPTGPIGDNGPASQARLYTPSDIVLHPNGNFIIVDEQNNRIRQVTPAGQISSIVGTGLHQFYAPVSATSSGMDWPGPAVLDPQGLLVFAELHSNRVARVGTNGVLVTIAGSGIPGFAGDGGPATAARLRNPTGIAYDASGNLYIADQGNDRIRRVTPQGGISTFAGDGDHAVLYLPTDLDIDAQGNVYVADMGNHRIVRIAPNGSITTVAGNGRAGFSGDGGSATDASLNSPAGIAVDSSGSLYIIDWQNYRIRKVTFSSRPAISAGGVVNGASFSPSPVPVSPGSIISIFGVNLAPSTALASAVPLPTELAGASVRINGIPAPLFFVSSGQINAQLPFEVPTGTATAIVRHAAGESAAETFNVATAAVGIFQFPATNRAVVLNQDGTVNGPDNPEARGRIMVVFLTGQGPLSPPVPTGQAAPSSPLSFASLRATANIGRAAADVKFLGLTPGFVGLAQANIEVPATAATGNEVVMFVSVDGQAGNTATVSIR